MKALFKLIRNIILLAILIIIIIVGLITYKGYSMYETALEKISLQDKITLIKQDSNYIKFSDIPKNLINATISIEDRRFYSHDGMDIISLARAIYINISKKSIEQGGSTITQQLAKNMYFTQEQEFSRKIAEAFMAFEIEKIYSKDEILELYLNTIYYGDGNYGIYEASKAYFNKLPKDLNLYECTLLAGVPNAPSIYAPTINADLCSQRQNQVISSMVDNEYISEEEAKDLYNK